ncbi:MAG: DUF1841 family protein [Steroidobacteraceae bacterium]
MTTADSQTVLGGYTREQLRRSYADAWRKQLAGSPLTPLEAMIADVIELHPQYQAFVEDIQAFESACGGLAENPFLHMGLHLAVREQVSIDRPPGIRELQRSLESRLGDLHNAEHVLMEALQETLWEAQRTGRPPDEGHYLELARRRAPAPSRK